MGCFTGWVRSLGQWLVTRRGKRRFDQGCSDQPRLPTLLIELMVCVGEVCWSSTLSSTRHDDAFAPSSARLEFLIGGCTEFV